MFRPVNPTVGSHPKFLSLGFYQLIPIVCIMAFVFYLRELLGFSWIMAVFLMGVLSGGVLLLLGDKPWLFFSRFVEAPYVVRGGAMYEPLLKQEEQNYYGTS